MSYMKEEDIKIKGTAEQCDWCNIEAPSLTTAVVHRELYDDCHPEFQFMQLCQKCLNGTEMERDGLRIFTEYLQLLPNHTVQRLESELRIFTMHSEACTTSTEFWDCECADSYIHHCTQDGCFKCGALRLDMPDSRINEVEAMLYEKAAEYAHSQEIPMGDER
jgi:hypothetical protein